MLFVCARLWCIGIWTGKSIRLSVHDDDDSGNGVSSMQRTSEEDLISSVNFVENRKEGKIGKC